MSGKNTHIYFFYSFCATDLNFGTKNNGGMKYSTLKTVIFASYWGSPLVQFSKFKNFPLVCWFLCKNLSNFVSLPLKFHNPYCHKFTYFMNVCHSSSLMYFHKTAPLSFIRLVSKNSPSQIIFRLHYFICEAKKRFDGQAKKCKIWTEKNTFHYNR